jgi:hypothetical protein
MHSHERRTKFLMDLDEETTRRIHSQLTEYTAILASLVQDTKPVPGTTSDIHDRYFSKFGELLCHRDELNAFLRQKLGPNSTSSLDTETLVNYERVFEYLESPSNSQASILHSSNDDVSLRISEDIRGICRMGLRMFGTRSTRGTDIESEAWDNIQKTFFPTVDPTDLRVAFYDKKLNDSCDIPRRWTFDEDLKIVEGVLRMGRGKAGIHHIYISLGELRSCDEIVDRIHVFFPEPQKRKNQSSTKTEIKSSESEWSVDDSLLLPSVGA